MIMDMEYESCECIQEVIQNGQRLQQIQSTQLTGCGGCITIPLTINVMPHCNIYKNNGSVVISKKSTVKPQF